RKLPTGKKWCPVNVFAQDSKIKSIQDMDSGRFWNRKFIIRPVDVEWMSSRIGERNILFRCRPCGMRSSDLGIGFCDLTAEFPPPVCIRRDELRDHIHTV